MLILGSGGMAKEVISAMEVEDFDTDSIYTFNNLDTSSDLVLDKYPVYHSWDQVGEHFKNIGPDFIVCIANPLKRSRLTEKALLLGGRLSQYISKNAVCRINESFGLGVIIQPGCIVPHAVTIHQGVFINAAVTVGHDSILHEYSSYGPGCRILGGVEVGAYSYIGTNSVILPGVKIGSKVRIGIGQIIKEDIPNNSKIG
jgi:sugar O-acyltransferase (sialic acid O-acetyltransferase NeuD family)